MGKAIPATLAVIPAAVCAYALQRQFGPEWVRVGDEYHRKVEVKAVHSAAGNTSNYTLPLEQGEVFVREVDHNCGFSIGSQTYGSFELKKGEDGRVTEYAVDPGGTKYFDLNGDGIIDAKYDKGRKPMVFFNGSYVPVEDSLDAFASREKWAAGRGRKFIFVGDRWKVE
ncbi:MAG TPA: hypothetical protein VFD58_28640 [Blastocatellia bacterium]|nr:hypothetical protein [Blastocatellia bacterium]